MNTTTIRVAKLANKYRLHWMLVLALPECQRSPG